ncbi:MAG: CBS domain-containing protein [Desulfobacteraceae bacterium]
MSDEKKVKDIMIPIEAYDTVSIDAHLCDALSILKKNDEDIKQCGQGTPHRTLFVVDGKDRIVGKISMYDLIRGLVPESAKKPEVSRAYHLMLSSRTKEVTEEVGDFQEEFKWLKSTFFELVSRESQKGVKDIMSEVKKSVIQEEDRINQAIYAMFKEQVRQQVIYRGNKAVGVINLNVIFSELLSIAGPECGINW